MGEVYRARDPRLGRDVALKVLSPETFAADADRRKRFEQEARAASALNHPNIVTIHDIGSSDSTIYIAMELVDGKTPPRVSSPGRSQRERSLDVGLPDGRRARRGARRRDRPPRPQARERHGLEGRTRSRSSTSASRSSSRSSPGRSRTFRRRTRPRPAWCSARSATCRPSRRAGRSSTFDPTSSRSARSSTRWRPGKRAFQRGTTAETLTAIIREETRARRAGRRLRTRAVPLDNRTLPPEGPRGALRLDTRPRAGRPERPRASLRGVGLALGGTAGPEPCRGGATRPLRWAAIARLVCSRPSGSACSRRDESEPAPPSYQQISLRQRHDPRGPLRAGRADDHLQPRLGRQPAEALPEASLEPGLAARSSFRARTSCDLPLRRDGDRRGLPLEPPRRLRRQAGARRADRRLAARRRRGIQEADWPRRRLDARGPRRRRARRASSTRMGRSSTRRPATSATPTCRRAATGSHFWTIRSPSTTRGPSPWSTWRARRRR